MNIVRFEEPECPGPDCLACNGSICRKCGAGTHTDPSRPWCEHDTTERHEHPLPGKYYVGGFLSPSRKKRSFWYLHDSFIEIHHTMDIRNVPPVSHSDAEYLFKKVTDFDGNLNISIYSESDILILTILEV